MAFQLSMMACLLEHCVSSAGIAPYMALELASYDLMPSEVPGFAKGFTAALFATSLCYPLDTVRYVSHARDTCLAGPFFGPAHQTVTVASASHFGQANIVVMKNSCSHRVFVHFC